MKKTLLITVLTTLTTSLLFCQTNQTPTIPNDFSNTNLLNVFYELYTNAPKLTTAKLSYQCYNYLTNPIGARGDIVKVAFDKRTGRGTTIIDSTNTYLVPLTIVSNKLTPVTTYVLALQSQAYAINTNAPNPFIFVPSPDIALVTNYFQITTPPKRFLEIRAYLKSINP